MTEQWITTWDNETRTLTIGEAGREAKLMWVGVDLEDIEVTEQNGIEMISYREAPYEGLPTFQLLLETASGIAFLIYSDYQKVIRLPHYVARWMFDLADREDLLNFDE